jgi:hypothetical protein
LALVSLCEETHRNNDSKNKRATISRKELLGVRSIFLFSFI